MKAIVTVVGKDQVGIIAAVCNNLANYNVNVLDISQTVMQGYFTMMMAVDVSGCTIPLAELCTAMEEMGKEKHLTVRVQREDIFEAMHRI
jgi:ACT domain-containing protein